MKFDDNIWYAVNQTRVVLEPEKVLETFGQTKIKYRIVCPSEDNVCKIREGIVLTEKPLIMSASQFAQKVLEGFGEKASEYADWLKGHGELLNVIQYGLQIRKEEISESEVHEGIDTTISKVVEVAEKDKMVNVVIQGVDEMWEVSLLKFMQSYMQRSAPVNFQTFQAHQVNAKAQIDREQDKYIEDRFYEARGNKTKINDLGRELQNFGRFHEFEDRFYALLREC